MDCKLVVVLVALFACNGIVKVDSAAMTALAAVDGVVGTADKITDLIGKLDQTFVKPIVNYIDAEVKKIDTNIDGITKEEKKMVTDTLTNLALTKNQIRRVRHVLKTLAEATISRTTTMTKLVQITMTTKNNAKTRKGLVLMAGEMQKTLDYCDEELKKSVAEYTKAVDSLSVAKVKLNEFANRVVILSSEASKEHKAEVEKIRAIAYGIASAGVVLGPPGVAAAMAAAAAIAEPRIKAWKKKLDALKRQCERSRKNALKTIAEVEGVESFLRKEESLVLEWKAKNANLKRDYADIDYLIMFMDFDDDMKKDQIRKLNALKGACQAFIDHINKNPIV